MAWHMPSDCDTDSLMLVSTCTAASTVHKFDNRYFSGYDLPGNPIWEEAGSGASRRGIQRGQCAAQCQAAAGCVMFVYGSLDWCDSCCWLKSTIDYYDSIDASNVAAYVGASGAPPQPGIAT